MKLGYLTLILTFIFVLQGCTTDNKSFISDSISRKNILYINSYHTGYEWSDGIRSGLATVLDDAGVKWSEVQLKSKGVLDEKILATRAETIYQKIKKEKPDLLITSDDNAFKYIIMKYFRDASIPVVFCGLNWDASHYGAPYSNTTGMIEVSLTTQLVNLLQDYNSGQRIGYLAVDVATARKEAYYVHKLLGISMIKKYVKTYAEWLAAYKTLQNRCDVLVLDNNAGIPDWNHEQAKADMLKWIKIPTGTTYSWMTDYAMISIIKSEKEQGEWAANAAIKILKGTPPSEIPVTTNQQYRLKLNLNLADQLHITFKPGLIKQAVMNTGHLQRFLNLDVI